MEKIAASSAAFAEKRERGRGRMIAVTFASALGRASLRAQRSADTKNALQLL
jgi:hypothetical protein